MPGAAEWSDQLTKAATVLGAFFVAGQTLSQVVEGYFKHRVEVAKLEQDRVLAKQKSDSDLAAQFLTLILSKDTSDEKRSLLYDALSRLQSHPLQTWALDRHKEIEQNLAALDRARNDRLTALQNENEATREVGDIQAQILELTAQVALHREDTELTDKLHNDQIIPLVIKLSSARATQVQAEAKTASVSEKTVSVSEISVTSFRLPIERLRSALTAPNRTNIFDAYMPFIESALIEFKLTDQKMVAAIIATAAFETNSFNTLTETTSGTIYEGRKDLGNTQPRDGERFKGRGFIQITGRANYSFYSQRLGLSTLLTDSPDDANKPEIASRILVYYFKKSEDKFAEALAGNDLLRIRRLVTGGIVHIDQFTQLYERTLVALQNS